MQQHTAHEGEVPNAPYGIEEVEETETEETEEESEEGIDFDEVTEVRFTGEVGPMGDRRLCKIRCVKGKWVGPLCATEDGKEKFFVHFYLSIFI